MTTAQMIAINIISMIWFLVGGCFYIRVGREKKIIQRLNDEIQEINREIQKAVYK